VLSSLPIRRNVSEDISILEKDAQTLKFIADSSLAGNREGMRRERDAEQHVGIVPLPKILQSVLSGARIQCMVHS
jgi:hypothetical protein